MTAKFLSTVIFISGICSGATAQTEKRSNIHIGFVYPLSSNGSQAIEYTNQCSFHAIAGVSRNEEAFCASGVASVIKDSATGLVASGVVNVIGNTAKGVQAAGFLNYTRNSVTGVQAAGFMNIAGSVNGVQAAGFGNIARENVDGLQAAGFVNVAKNTNVQASGFVNVADTIDGAQLSGFINVARKVKGPQVSSYVNVAKDVEGAQIAGFINIARKVKGPQISGFINIADSSDCPIGLINLIKNGEKAIGVTVNENGTTMAAFRSGGHIMYGIIGVGGNFVDGNSAFAFQSGFGAHLPLSHAFRFNIEATSTTTVDFRGNSDLRAGIRVMPSIRFGIVELFGGPSFNYTTSKDIQGIGFSGNSVWRETGRHYTRDLSLGLEGGVQFHLDKSRKTKTVTPE